MNLRTVIVDLDSIQAQPYTGAADVVEALANTIIQLRGLISLPVIKMLAIDQYELLSGELEFHAYGRAHQMDDSLPESMMAFLAKDETVAPIRQQQEVLAMINGRSQATAVATSSSSLDASNLSAQIDRLAKTQDQSLSALQSAILAAIQETIPQPLAPLTALNRVDETAVQVQIASNFVALGKTKVKKIIDCLKDAKKQGKSFNSFADVLATLIDPANQKRLVSEKKMLEIIDGWHS